MEYKDMRVIEAETIDNTSCVREVRKRKKFSFNLDILDVIIVPVAVALLVACSLLAVNIVV